MRSRHLVLLLGLAAWLLAVGRARGAVVEELSIEPGGSLDIQAEEILTSTPAETVRQYIQSGRLYSSAHADMTNPLYTVGFQQVVVDQQDALRVVEALAGDANLDGIVNVSDLGIWAGNWNQQQQLAPEPAAHMPEPVTMATFGLAGLAVWRKARKRLRLVL
jgi:hypothetical protein